MKNAILFWALFFIVLLSVNTVIYYLQPSRSKAALRNQPYALANHRNVNSKLGDVCADVYVKTSPQGGQTGNVLYKLAGMIGLALRSNFTPVITGSMCTDWKVTTVTEDFTLANVKFMCDKRNSCLLGRKVVRISVAETEIGEDGLRNVQHKLDLMALLGDTPRKNIVIDLNSNLQDFRYFVPFGNRVINQQFQFKPYIIHAAKQFLNSISNNPNTIFVGLHFRLQSQVRRMRIPLNKLFNYFERGMSLISNRTAPKRRKFLVFVVCSDDIPWVKRMLNVNKFNVVYSEGNSGRVDMTILSLCQHGVFTGISSYSHWAAFFMTFRDGNTTEHISVFPDSMANYGTSLRDIAQNQYYSMLKFMNFEILSIL